MYVAAVILHGSAVILHSMTSIWSNVHDILHFQHQFFEIFRSVLGFSKGKIHFFPKVLKNWSSCQKNGYHFLGGRVRAQSDKNHFFFFFFEAFPYLIFIFIQGEFQVEKCDLSSLTSVRQFAAKMLETESKVDILINCAGVKETPQWTTQVIY